MALSSWASASCGVAWTAPPHQKAFRKRPSKQCLRPKTAPNSCKTAQNSCQSRRGTTSTPLRLSRSKLFFTQARTACLLREEKSTSPPPQELPNHHLGARRQAPGKRQGTVEHPEAGACLILATAAACGAAAQARGAARLVRGAAVALLQVQRPRHLAMVEIC